MPSPPDEQTRAIAARLKDLTTSLGWDTYVTAIDQEITLNIERLITGRKEDFDHQKGVIEGLRLARYLPTKLINQAK